MAEIKRYLVLADLALEVPDYLETPLSFQERKSIRDLIQRADQRGQDLLPILRQFAASINGEGRYAAGGTCRQRCQLATGWRAGSLPNGTG